jgi:hypothetical protein
MAKAVVPLGAFREKLGNPSSQELTERVLKIALEFLHEHHLVKA